MFEARWIGSAGLFVAILAAASCSSSDASAPGVADAGADGDVPADGPGWRGCTDPFEADPSGLGCRPIVATTCGMGQRPQLGSATCVDVAAAPCAAGFAADGWGCKPVLPAAACTLATKETLGATTCAPIDDCSDASPRAGATLFVDASGASDATHFTTIGAAVAAAAAGATISIAAGTYAESITASRSIHLVGTCASQVTIASAATGSIGIAAASSAVVTLEHVTLSGHMDAATADSGASLTLHQMVIDGSVGRGAAATGATLTVDSSVIRGSGSHGIEGASGATIKVTGSAIVGNTDTGIKMAGTGGDLTILSSAILGTRSTTGGFGLGVIVRDGAKGDVSNTAIADNHEVGLLVYGKGSTASLTDSVVARTVASSDAVYGRGVLVDTGSVTIARTTLDGNQENAVVAEDAGMASLDGCVSKNTVPDTEGNDGNGATAISGGAVSFTNSAVVANGGAGVEALGAGSTVSLAQSLVMGTKGDATGQRGFGLALEMGGGATVTDVAFVENRDAGVAATDVGSSITADHLLVLRTLPGVGDTHGRGFGLEAASTGTLTKSAILDNQDIGVQARDGATLTFDELVVSGTLPQKVDGAHGRGLECDSATIDGKHATFDANHGVSVLSIAMGSAVTLSSIWVAGTLPDPSGAARALTAQENASLSVDSSVLAHSAQAGAAATASARLTITSSIIDTADVANGDFGHGVLAWQDSLVSLTDVTIQGCAGAGLVFDGSRGTVSGGHVTGNAVGIAAQDGSTLEESDSLPDDPSEGEVVVSSSTAFDNNGANIGSGVLVLPTPLAE